MSSQQIRTLLFSPSAKDANEKVVDFLNSRVHAIGDLDQLELLVLDAQQRNDELQSRFLLSQSKIDTLLTNTRVSAETHIHTAQELSLLRHSLTDELTELSHELISSFSEGQDNPTLLEDLETLHRNLKELQSVKGYIQVIEHALQLSEKSVEYTRSAKLAISAPALSEYQALHAFVIKVSEACSDVDDGSGHTALNLVQLLFDIREKTWLDMQGTLASFLVESAEKIGWPTAVDYSAASAQDRAAFEQTFQNLLKLQNWGEKNGIIMSVQQHHQKDGLYALQALVQPISLRFRYHFEGSRQTNRLDKPEWYFTHILNIAHEHRVFMESVVQRLIDSSEYRGISAQQEFTYLLLPLLSRKIKHTVPLLLSHPSLLAHTIYQTLTFDAMLVEDGFSILETSAAQQQKIPEKWDGVSEVILGNTEWFNSWLSGEQKFADDQYHEIIGSADAWLIAADDEHDDDSQSYDIKSTNSARRICSLIQQVTDRYSTLPHFNQRTRFLLDVQLPLLEHYRSRIVSSLDAFETLSSVFARAVPGALSVSLGGKEEGSVHVDNRGLTSGVEGVQRLCKALLSTKYVGIAMQTWSEELFFVELWTEVNRDSALRGQALTSPLLPDLKVQSGEVPDNTLFDNLSDQYQRLLDRAEGMVVQQVSGEVENLLKVHFSATSQKPSQDQTENMALSQTLLAPIALLSSHLTFLKTIMPRTTLTTLYRRIISRLAEHILQRQILYRGHFSLSEGKTIHAECELWVETCRTALGGSLLGGRARLEAPWNKLLQAASLASAEGEAWAVVVDVTFGAQDSDDWESAVSQAVGPLELRREEVARILRRREDCEA